VLVQLASVNDISRMKFGHFNLAEALGAILANSIATPEGVLRRVLGAADLARLAAAGHSDVVAARLEAGDVGENEAAHRVAAAAAGPGTRVAPPFTGRANLYADALGLAIFDPTAVAAVNALDEGLTVATLSPFERVAAGQMIATVKVITFSLPEPIVAQAEAILKASPALASIRTFAPKAAGLVLTRMTSIKSGVLEPPLGHRPAT
jgi:molybdenum cofactor cytidylyltransferase